MDSLRRAAEHLPRIDAIGGSAAGVYVDNQVKFASLFRGVRPTPSRSACGTSSAISNMSGTTSRSTWRMTATSPP